MVLPKVKQANLNLGLEEIHIRTDRLKMLVFFIGNTAGVPFTVRIPTTALGPLRQPPGNRTAY